MEPAEGQRLLLGCPRAPLGAETVRVVPRVVQRAGRASRFGRLLKRLRADAALVSCARGSTVRDWRSIGEAIAAAEFGSWRSIASRGGKTKHRWVGAAEHPELQVRSLCCQSLRRGGELLETGDSLCEQCLKTCAIVACAPPHAR